MPGIKIPNGAATPEVRHKNTNHITPNMRAFCQSISLLSDINDLIVLDYDSKKSVANRSNELSGHRNYLIGNDGFFV
jgi:hypothetical protein